MRVRYKSFGAARTVTGSRHFFEIGDFNVLLDCGLFQGIKEVRTRNWNAFPVPTSEVQAVVLSHAHIDHSGYLPKLVKEGFNGPIYCTRATEALLRIMLIDSAKLQEEEAEWAGKKGYSKHSPPLPLYTEKDAEKVFPLIHALDFDMSLRISDNLQIRFLNAGHILGAGIVELTIEGDTLEKKIVFSGDLGRQEDPLLFPPVKINDTDILLVESTYGDRSNTVGDVAENFAGIINDGISRGGCIVIPAFSVGRTQNILFYLRQLMEKKVIPAIPVYIDSPMAISVTDLYRSFDNLQKLEKGDLEENSIFDYRHFHYVRSQEQSAEINKLKKNAIIISASGMCNGGRILHHLYHRLPNTQDTLIMVGYQADGTRGRRLSDGEKLVSIFGQSVEVNCTVEMLTGLSAHADNEELLDWMGSLGESPKKTFIVHGEEEASFKLGKEIQDKLGWKNIYIPHYEESFELFNGI